MWNEEDRDARLPDHVGSDGARPECAHARPPMGAEQDQVRADAAGGLGDQGGRIAAGDLGAGFESALQKIVQMSLQMFLVSLFLDVEEGCGRDRQHTADRGLFSAQSAVGGDHGQQVDFGVEGCGELFGEGQAVVVDRVAVQRDEDAAGGKRVRLSRPRLDQQKGNLTAR